jgi:hypothetical protein
VNFEHSREGETARLEYDGVSIDMLRGGSESIELPLEEVGKVKKNAAKFEFDCAAATDHWG